MRRCGYWGPITRYVPVRPVGPGPCLGVVDRWSAPAEMRVLVGATPTVLGRLEDNSHQDRRRNRCVQDGFAELHATVEGLADGRHSVFPRLYRRRRRSGKPEERGAVVDADACPHFLAGHRFTCRRCPTLRASPNGSSTCSAWKPSWACRATPTTTGRRGRIAASSLGRTVFPGRMMTCTNATRGGATTSAWCRSPRLPPAVGGSVASEEVCREVLSVPAPPKPGKLLRESETGVQVSSAAG